MSVVGLVGCGRDTSQLRSGDESHAIGGKKAQGGMGGGAGEGGTVTRAGSSNGGNSATSGGNTAMAGSSANAGSSSLSGAAGASVSGGAAGSATPNGGTSGSTTPNGGTAGVAASNGGTAGVAASNGGTAGSTAPNGGTAGSATPNGGTAGFPTAGAAGTTLSPIAEVLDVGPTYSGQPTDMSLVTIGNQQFVAYWGADQAMTVASRVLGEKTWSRIALAPHIQNDGHHSIVLAADKQGYLHLSGRMHNEALTYLRTSAPMDISKFQLIMTPMVKAADEQSCTYPRFFLGPIGDLVFSYRSGASGQGDTIFNVYNATTKTWSRLLGSLLINGEGANSAYIVGPTKGPDGYWHMVWTWRQTAAAETNHDLSYARTKDFLNWEKGDGTPITLPVTLATADIVDPVPVSGGMINNNTKVGFDSQNRPVVVYHKFDASGATQLYNARVEGGRWVTHQTSNWSSRWAFSGYNTIAFQIEVDGVRAYPNGQLKQLYYNANEGNHSWAGFVVNETTLAATEVIKPPYPYPAALETVESTTAGMRARWWPDAGSGPDADIYYMMRWETLDPNGDQPRTPEPPPTTLRVYGFRRSVMTQLQ